MQRKRAEWQSGIDVCALTIAARAVLGPGATLAELTALKATWRRRAAANLGVGHDVDNNGFLPSDWQGHEEAK